MQSIYLRVFDFIDNAKPTHLGIYFSLFFHLSILLFAIGLPDFFKPNKIPMPQIIPIEILNISDVTSLAPKKEILETNINESKKIKQKKFNSSENTEVQKIDLQEKPKKNITQNENKTDNTFVTPKLETKKTNILKEEKITKLETIKVDKIKPKLKPKPIEKIEPKSDMTIQNKIKPEIKKNEEKKIIDKPKPIQKPQPDFNIASVLKDLRNEEVSNIIEDNNNEKKLENNEEETNIKENLEKYNCKVIVSDECAENKESISELNITLVDLDQIEKMDALIIAVEHKKYTQFNIEDFENVLVKLYNLNLTNSPGIAYPAVAN